MPPRACNDCDSISFSVKRERITYCADTRFAVTFSKCVRSRGLQRASRSVSAGAGGRAHGGGRGGGERLASGRPRGQVPQEPRGAPPAGAGARPQPGAPPCRVCAGQRASCTAASSRTVNCGWHAVHQRHSATERSSTRLGTSQERPLRSVNWPFWLEAGNVSLSHEGCCDP